MYVEIMSCLLLVTTGGKDRLSGVFLGYPNSSADKDWLLAGIDGLPEVML